MTVPVPDLEAGLRFYGQALGARFDDAVEMLTGHGGDLVASPFDIPVGRAAVVRGPFRNTLVLVDLSKGAYTADGAIDPTATGSKADQLVPLPGRVPSGNRPTLRPRPRPSRP